MAAVTWPKVVLYGSSMVQRSFGVEGYWGGILAAKLQRRCDVLNRGFSGYNTRWNRIMLPRLLGLNDDHSSVRAFVILLGGNDSTVKELDPRLHVPPDEYKDNLKYMVSYLETVGVGRDKVILVSPSPCDIVAWTQTCKELGYVMAKDSRLGEVYAKKCSEAALESGAEFVDLYTAMMAVQNWPSLLCDGLHLSPPGSELLAELLWPAIHRRTADLPTIMPLWSEVDYENPERSFV